MINNTENTLKVAQQAFEHFTKGLATGEWQGFIDILTEDFTFWFPLGKFQGWNVGKERARDFFQYVSASFPGGLHLSLDSFTNNERTVVFQFHDEGILFTQPYKNRIAVSFDVCENKICGYREYFGSDGKSSLMADG